MSDAQRLRRATSVLSDGLRRAKVRQEVDVESICRRMLAQADAFALRPEVAVEGVVVVPPDSPATLEAWAVVVGSSRGAFTWAVLPTRPHALGEAKRLVDLLRLVTGEPVEGP